MLNTIYRYARIRLCKRVTILTLGELETLACFGTTGLLALYDARVAGHEAFGTERALVLGVDLHEGAGDGETESLGLTFVTAAVEVDFDVILLGLLECQEGLLLRCTEGWKRGSILRGDAC